MTDASHTAPAPGVERVENLRATLRLTSQGKIIGQHPSIREVVSTVERVASSNCTVLITGESGTGKGLVVAALHDASLRAKGPVVTVDCSTIPEQLIEAQLFGHVRGAYTGAVSSTQGFVAAADGGTLVLDEVGELPLLMQVKLLRLLQQREYIPVGDTKPVRCDIRVVAATNRNLEVEVAAGRFREDLFYRINVVHVHLPPLRERPGDIALLALNFLRTVTARNGRSTPTGDDPEAMHALSGYPWPGNIRELENAIERAVLLAPATLITFNDLPPKVRAFEGAATPWGEPPATASQVNVVGPGPSSDPFFRAVQPEDLLPADQSLAALFRGGLPDDVLPAVPPSPFAPPVLPEDGVDLAAALEAFETSLILQALRRTGGNRHRAAQVLRMNRTTLIEKIRRKRLGV